MNLLGSDYQLLMSILSKNMTEGASERVAPKKAPETGKQRTHVKCAIFVLIWSGFIFIFYFCFDSTQFFFVAVIFLSLIWQREFFFY